MGVIRKVFRGKRQRRGSQPPAELPPAERAAAELSAWARAHFPRQGGLRFAFYRTDSGTEISLRNARVEKPAVTEPFGNESGGKYHQGVQLGFVLLTSAARKLADAMQVTLAVYRDHEAGRAALPEALRSDPFFERVGEVFAAKLTVMLHELTYCQYERCDGSDNAYCTVVCERLFRLVRELRDVNRLCADYLYALTRAELEDPGMTLDEIRISVQAMTEVTESDSQTGLIP